MPIRFRFRAIPFVAAGIAVAIGLSAGQWQMRRAAAKEAIEAKLAARSAAAPLALHAAPVDVDKVEYRRVSVSGEFVGAWSVYLDNRPNNGAAGLYLLMPLKIEGTDRYVLVARGWIPRDRTDRAKLPSVVTPSGTVHIEGIARRNPGHLMQLGTAEPVRPQAILQNLEIAEFAAASKLALQPILIEQTNDVQDGLTRNWPRPSNGIEKHYGYAVQWYGLALTALLFFVVTGCRREPKK